MNIWNWWKKKKEEQIEYRSDVQEVENIAPVKPLYQIADHLVVMRLGTSHHGIYSGNDQVIYYHYYSGFVVENSLEEFSQGAPIKVMYSPVLFNSSLIISRGRSRVGERNLQGFSNRSEEFVRWVRGGDIW